jgi:alkanesulfonate monooxygenase SsuD/methylene tetrahydromethanopterin reductase-like flavin-dependent oxidoreductase (luciferase family)
MKLGLYSMNFGTCADPDTAVEIAQYAEAAGFESVWVGEHVVLPRHPPEWFTMPHTLPFLDAVVGMTLLAAHTSRVKIGCGILELPLHHPIRLAKQLASIDRISHGRLLVGVGAGYLEPEFKAMGVELADRGRCGRCGRWTSPSSTAITSTSTTLTHTRGRRLCRARP